MSNPYAVLGVSPSSTLKEIKNKYRELSKKYHPDDPSTGDKDKFVEIDLAWRQIEKFHVGSMVLKKDVWVHKSFFRIIKEV